MDFKQFDRSLEDFRDETARASLVMGRVAQRYVAMMQALDAGFTLLYENMPVEDKAKMRAAFDELATSVQNILDYTGEAAIAVPGLADAADVDAYLKKARDKIQSHVVHLDTNIKPRKK